MRGVLPKQAVDEFKTIYKEMTGDDISYEEAENRGISFLRLVDLISRPIPDPENGDQRSSNQDTE